MCILSELAIIQNVKKDANFVVLSRWNKLHIIAKDATVFKTGDNKEWQNEGKKIFFYSKEDKCGLHKNHMKQWKEKQSKKSCTHRTMQKST